ncbi:hypothetical protein DPMN_176289 [Dreissena polymorpha]|uniref:Uncharacterized protein n=1 Tax=Dreissena polymorpha TaxID=45954 RepID=A0A9D4E991_DREPO|nr:hypothetical protein DPMN_176289 [Dreissena polymorpha]
MATLQRPYHVPTTTTASLWLPYEVLNRTPYNAGLRRLLRACLKWSPRARVLSNFRRPHCVPTASLWRPHCDLGRRKDAVRTPVRCDGGIRLLCRIISNILFSRLF